MTGKRGRLPLQALQKTGGQSVCSPQEKSEYLADCLERQFTLNLPSDLDEAQEIEDEIEETLGRPITSMPELTSEEEVAERPRKALARTVSATLKVFESLVQRRVLDHLASRDILIHEQFGFHRGHSSTHQLMHFVETMANAGSSKELTVAVFLDVEKAFNSVWHAVYFAN